MIHRGPSRVAIGLATALLLASGVAARADRTEARIVAEGADGQLEVGTGRRLVVDATSMDVAIRAARPGQFIFAARSRENRRELRSVEVRFDDHTYEVRRPQGAEVDPIVMEIAISPEVHVELSISDGRCQVTGIEGGVSLAASGADVETRATAGWVQLEVTDGSARVSNHEGSVSLVGQRVEGSLRRVNGNLRLETTDGSLELREIIGSLEGTLQRVTLSGQTILGPAQLDVVEGRVEIQELRNGGDLRLDGTPLTIGGSGGELDVDTDGDVRFQNVLGSLSVRHDGSDVRGSGVKGNLRLDGGRGRIDVEKVDGAVVLEGDELTVSVRSVKGAVRMRCSGCELVLEDLESTADVENDYGGVTIRKAAQKIRVVSRGGSVVADGLSGAAEIEADGETVDVTWAELAENADSTVSNQGGDVKLSLPPRSGGRLEVEAPYGRISSALPEIRVSGDESKASGVLGGRDKPRIEVTSGGNVYLETAEAPQQATPGQPGPRPPRGPGNR